MFLHHLFDPFLPLHASRLGLHIQLQIIYWNILLNTSGFARTLVVVSVRQPVIYWSPHPPPTNLSPTLKFILEKIKLTATFECGASIHAIIQLMVLKNPDVFSLKPSQSQRESSLKIWARWGSPFQRS